MGPPWDAGTYDQSSEPQQAWASEVLARLECIAQDARVLDVSSRAAVSGVYDKTLARVGMR